MQRASLVLAGLAVVLVAGWLFARAPSLPSRQAVRHSQADAYAEFGRTMQRHFLDALELGHEPHLDPAPDGRPDYVREQLTSPDGRYIVRAKYGGSAVSLIAVRDTHRGTETDVLGIGWGDPSSGSTHRFEWSTDSSALIIFGYGRPIDCQGCSIPLIYLPELDVVCPL